MPNKIAIQLKVNGQSYECSVEPRMLLSDFLRHELKLTGTHVGCEQGVCGSCTILVDGLPARSCLMFAVQAQGLELTTVEGLGSVRENGEFDLHPLQEAFWEEHGLQCGYCTPGFLMTLLPFLERNPNPTEQEVREMISGNLCRCTGYQNIVKAAMLAAEKMRIEAE